MEQINISNNNAVPAGSGLDVFCFCHLRWDFVFQRPQHLMIRFAREGRVFVIEEPVLSESEHSHIDVSDRGENIYVCTPKLAPGDDAKMPHLVSDLAAKYGSVNYLAWFYTPMMIEWSERLDPVAVVYDCMDELAAFKNAPPELLPRERKLFEKADLVFTGGHTLYEAKRQQHQSVHAFPSSIDVAHFGKALEIDKEIPEHTAISRPRIGFVGVIDERTDIELLDSISRSRTDWNFVMVGPVVKIAESDLPRRDNIHYLGQRSYDELPAILSGWDVAMMPFALNEATRYISPTKTPEYLAAGLPVVSTAITDVVRPYGELGLVHIARTPEEFIEAIEAALNEDAEDRRRRAGAFLSKGSWDKTYGEMKRLISESIESRRPDVGSARAGS